ncbi:hypothetical protein KFL_012230020 [Klebsormidium nitens]|uniref:Retrotransposon gag domain-containing protein n=1 Tax=Klebsormidium nitens TaxID=105231 RepID=A0A1Y1IXE4_KLENI|nr:hypothetical protein KFL_012230020 [Klebsormidium nitens]|eukprot:GAQ92958.1 hypothetical protein KFL_012230020 [Klebsormidium nitens]
MSKEERLASFLDRITDLCFTISELGSGGSEGEVGKPSTGALSPEAPAFTPASKGKEQVSGANVVGAAPPSKFENKESDHNIRQWLPMIEEYLAATPNADYLGLASPYLNGKPRSYWISQWEAWQAANPGAYPGDAANTGNFAEIARQYFQETMIRSYGLRTPIQSYWDTWNKLFQGSKSVEEYNVEFNQAMVNLRKEITDEAVKIERYESGLQPDLREMCRTSPTSQRWATLKELGEYATLMWPTVQPVQPSDPGPVSN